MAPTELSYLSITEASNGLRRKEFSPVELAQACLERIESIDGKLHSFITVTADLALEQARNAEQELRAGTDKGPLHGIPIALKDLYATKNIRTTCHSAVLQDWVPDHDADNRNGNSRDGRHDIAGQVRNARICVWWPIRRCAVSCGS